MTDTRIGELAPGSARFRRSQMLLESRDCLRPQCGSGDASALVRGGSMMRYVVRAKHADVSVGRHRTILKFEPKQHVESIDLSRVAFPEIEVRDVYELLDLETRFACSKTQAPVER